MEPVERDTNLSFRVARKLGRAIVRGEFAPDDALPTEAELCKTLSVSRTAVREAVKMLAAKGLVSSKPRRGIRVMAAQDWNIFDPHLLEWSLDAVPTDALLNEFFQLRLAIEPEAAALAARLATDSDKATVGEAFARMCVEPKGTDLAFEADLDFHVAILYATGNRFFIRLRDFVKTALNVTIQFTTPAAGPYDEVLAAHRKVLQAIESGDVDQARLRMRLLIEDASDVFENQADVSERTSKETQHG